VNVAVIVAVPPPDTVTVVPFTDTTLVSEEEYENVPLTIVPWADAVGEVIV
jgi:hypothetical protein